MKIELENFVKPAQMIFSAPGIHGVCKKDWICILESNISKGLPALLQPCIVLGSESPDCKIWADSSELLKPTTFFNALHYNKVKDMQRKIELQIKVEIKKQIQRWRMVEKGPRYILA